jgi:hypothetical protein
MAHISLDATDRDPAICQEELLYDDYSAPHSLEPLQKIWTPSRRSAIWMYWSPGVTRAWNRQRKRFM